MLVRLKRVVVQILLKGCHSVHRVAIEVQNNLSQNRRQTRFFFSAGKLLIQIFEIVQNVLPLLVDLFYILHLASNLLQDFRRNAVNGEVGKKTGDQLVLTGVLASVEFI